MNPKVSFLSRFLSSHPVRVLATLLRPAAAREAFRIRRWERAAANAPVVQLDPGALLDCAPASLTANPELLVLWLKGGTGAAHAPFYSQAMIRAWERLKRPPLFRTPFENLQRLVTVSPGVPPAGFIFQLSRCGSTLVSNMLATAPDTLVVAEPDALNQILALNLDLSSYLPPLISALGRDPGSRATRLFIKFTSWNVLRLRPIHFLFPHVPWAFVFRDPIEVLVSNLRERGGWMNARHNPAHPLNRECLDGHDPLQISEAEYAARIIAAFCRAALNAPADNRILLEYSDIGPHLPSRLSASFALPDDSGAQARMAACLRFYSKDQRQKKRYRSDTQRKLAAATPAVRDAALEFIQPVYEQLRAAAQEQAAAARSAVSVL